MSKRKLALKRLTASDLTIFKWQFENNSAGNQKAINLNRNIFVDLLYPALPEAAAEKDGRLPLDLRIFGPGGKLEINLQRKIIKHGAYKNWRLNGEFINNPSEDPDRFNILQAGDLVVFDFFGGVIPTSASMILISGTSSPDISLYQALDEIIGDKKMVALTEHQLAQIISDNNVDNDHPVNNIVYDEVLEDIVRGGPEGLERIWHGVSHRHLTREALEKARRKSEDNGRTGEQLVNDYLLDLIKKGVIESLEWTSEDINPVAPYDFKIKNNKEDILIDVKTTDGEFSRRLHISMNEIRQIANGSERYDLYRVYEIGDTEAKLRIASNIGRFGQSVLTALTGLPEGVTPNGFSFNPEKLGFGDEMVIKYPDEEID